MFWWLFITTHVSRVTIYDRVASKCHEGRKQCINVPRKERYRTTKIRLSEFVLNNKIHKTEQNVVVYRKSSFVDESVLKCPDYKKVVFGMLPVASALFYGPNACIFWLFLGYFLDN